MEAEKNQLRCSSSSSTRQQTVFLYLFICLISKKNTIDLLIQLQLFCAMGDRTILIVKTIPIVVFFTRNLHTKVTNVLQNFKYDKDSGDYIFRVLSKKLVKKWESKSSFSGIHKFLLRQIGLPEKYVIMISIFVYSCHTKASLKGGGRMHLRKSIVRVWGVRHHWPCVLPRSYLQPCSCGRRCEGNYLWPRRPCSFSFSSDQGRIIMDLPHFFPINFFPRLVCQEQMTSKSRGNDELKGYNFVS